ncbi:ABC transporter substrate-binding protein [Haloarchaeobius sp. HME9146]|uniref:ABC transporter substrate-binding protein n=1 Tax=Haloarchaeobius sp. HME9146 TaxID=2978732 RepID=UPI0021BE6D07|nr:ABC transporter substrate-binding protein [Haloarchaeobius sp. HME9146]MCT9098486.1 ABC transporter substrate-binding protein [Haloarchaeobius sp. HME9146]
MSEDETGPNDPTRRAYLKYGTALVGGSLLAGCAGQSDTGDSEPTSTQTATATDEPAATESGATDESAEETETPESWTVSMKPRTEVTFESVPDSVVVYRADYADMLIALGQGDALVGMQDTQSLPMDMLAELPGVSVDPAQITPLRQEGEYDKEIFYDIDPDLLLIDPNNAKNYFEFDEADISELENTVAPWLGSFIRRPQESIGPNYPHYTLYEAFERVATAFRAEDRFAAFKSVHDEMLSTISERVPPESERPSVGLAFLIPGDQFVGSGVFYLTDPTQPGMAKKQYRDLGVDNVWAEAGVSMDGQVNYEALLEADPDVLISHNAFGFTDSVEDFQTRVVDVMREDDLGKELTAVKNGRVYRGGKNVQGPIINLFQTEIAAKQLYPETFGAWKGLGETPADEQLFDRQRVADIINGDF